MDGLLGREVPATALVVAVDLGKALDRVWLTSGERGLIGEPVTLAVLREGVDELERLIGVSGVAGAPVIGVEATGGLHRAWAAEIERRWPGSLRLFAPSETTAARAQLGSRRFNDRDCAAMVWLLRQGAGRPAGPQIVASMVGTVCYRRQLVDARRVLQQRLHDQLNARCPGLSAPREHGRALKLEGCRRPGGARVRRGVGGTSAEQALLAGSSTGSHNRRDRRLLGAALETAAGAAC